VAGHVTWFLLDILCNFNSDEVRGKKEPVVTFLDYSVEPIDHRLQSFLCIGERVFLRTIQLKIFFVKLWQEACLSFLVYTFCPLPLFLCNFSFLLLFFFYHDAAVFNLTVITLADREGSKGFSVHFE